MTKQRQRTRISTIVTTKPPLYARLVKAHNNDPASTLADHHVNFTHIPLILQEGLLTPEQRSERLGKTYHATRGANQINFYHIINIEAKGGSEEVPQTFIPFAKVVVKLPKKANWVHDEKEALPPEERRLDNPTYQNARIHTTEHVGPQHILALRLCYPSGFNISRPVPARHEEIQALLTRGQPSKKPLSRRLIEFGLKSDEQIANEVAALVHRETNGKTSAGINKTKSGIEITVPWLELAIGMANKKGIPVYGWDGKLIE